jgi:sulfatase maturation enzyme AslB (radical SAM superfamily)
MCHHIKTKNWLYTPDQNKRGYIQPDRLRELWFHTGTICNLSCPFCFEGSGPGDSRIPVLTYEDVKPFIDEAVELDVEKFCFTGGEPFVVRDIIRILETALEYRPCLVLTNATEPVIRRLDEVLPLIASSNPLSFRISLDHPDPQKHDEGRGSGNFAKALNTGAELFRHGFRISIARKQTDPAQNGHVDQAYKPFFRQAGLPEDTHIVSFPELLLPFSQNDVPAITENCMTTYKTAQERADFMCSYSKMVLKVNGKMAVYACTLVDDDDDYNLGDNLHAAMRARVMLRHHRCFGCFSCGTSCSEN